MKRLARTSLLGLFAAGCLLGWGCDVSPLQRDLDPASVGSQAVEFYLPPTSSLGEVISDLLTQREGDVLRLNIPPMQGSLGGPLEFVSSKCDLEIPVFDLGAEVLGGRLQVTARMGAAEVTVPLDVYTDGQLLRTCFLRVLIPERWMHVTLAFGSAPDNGLSVLVEGAPDIIGTPVVAELDFDCPEQPGSDVEPVVIGSVEEVIQNAIVGLASELAEVAGNAIGAESGASGSVEERIDFLVHPDPDAANMGDSDLQIGLLGGFKSSRAPCVPADAADLPPTSEPPAVFSPKVPDAGGSYGMGISVSKGFLNQGLAAAYRGGLLCRQAGAGDLRDVHLDDLFPSQKELGPVSAIRAAVWPGGQPEMEFSPPDPNEGETLPRLMVTLPRLLVDIYVNLEWTDVRLLSVTADVLLVLSPRFENGSLSFRLFRAHIGSMSIQFSKLLGEVDDVLRTGAIAATERVIARMVEDMDLEELPRPPCGDGDLLGAVLEGGRILLYFAP